MTSTSRLRARITITIALALTVALVAAACGTRLDREQIIASAYGGGVTSGEQGVAGPEGAPEAEGGALGELDEAGGAVGGDDQATGAGGAADADGTAAGRNSAAAARGGAKKRDGGSGGGPIVIGSVGTYSGPAGAAYASAAQALQAWAAAVNARGGINGRKVQVIVYDDGGNGAKARSQVQELVEDRNGVAVVSAMASLTLPQWTGYVEKKGVPVIGGECALDVWNESPVLFTQCAAGATHAYSVVSLGAKMVGKGKKFGALICQEATGCTQFEKHWFDDGMVKQAGLVPAYKARISIAQPDFTSECISARNAGVEIMSVLGDPNTVARVGASCKRQNYTPQFVQVGPTMASNTPSQPGLSNVIATGYAFPFAGLKTPATAEFHAAWKRYAGGSDPSGAASMAWAAGKLFEKAATKAGADISPAGLMKAMGTIKNDRLKGLTVPLTYTTGKPTPDFKCWFVMQAKNGKWTAPQGDRLDCR